MCEFYMFFSLYFIKILEIIGQIITLIIASGMPFVTNKVAKIWDIFKLFNISYSTLKNKNIKNNVKKVFVKLPTNDARICSNFTLKCNF